MTLPNYSFISNLSNLATTEIYTHLSNKQMESAANANPLSEVKQRNIDRKKEPK